VLVKALSPAFFAREDTLAPLWATLKAVVVAIVCAILLGHFFGAAGIAAGVALGAWSNALSLIRQGGASFGFSVDQAARRRLPRIVAAALIMGGALRLATDVIAAPMHGTGQAVVLLLLIAGGITVYATFLALFAVTSWREAVNAIRQRGPRDLQTDLHTDLPTDLRA
jgi:putative peptidoglycan lipid II flippase